MSVESSRKSLNLKLSTSLKEALAEVSRHERLLDEVTTSRKNNDNIDPKHWSMKIKSKKFDKIPPPRSEKQSPELKSSRSISGKRKSFPSTSAKSVLDKRRSVQAGLSKTALNKSLDSGKHLKKSRPSDETDSESDSDIKDKRSRSKQHQEEPNKGSRAASAKNVSNVTFIDK